MSFYTTGLNRMYRDMDVPANTGLPAGTFVNARDYEGLQTLVDARRNMPPGLLNVPQVPQQLQRQQPAYPMPESSGRFGQLAAQMAGPAGQMPQQQIPMTPPINPTGGMINPRTGLPAGTFSVDSKKDFWKLVSYMQARNSAPPTNLQDGIPMAAPTDILRMLGGYNGQF